MVRIVLALVIGVVVAFGSTFAVVQVANSAPTPVNKNLYNYGSR